VIPPHQRLTEKKFSVNTIVKKKKTVIHIMKKSYRVSFGLCSVIIAALLLLAVPVAAMGMAPGAASCSTPGYLSVSGLNMQIAQDWEECINDCYSWCSYDCIEGGCWGCHFYCKDICKNGDYPNK
jgi:hypothetical protein